MFPQNVNGTEMGLTSIKCNQFMRGLGDMELPCVYRPVRKIAKSHYELPDVCLSIRSSAWNNSVSTGRIFIKFDICKFFKNVSRKFQFH